jgi:predicted permease
MNWWRLKQRNTDLERELRSDLDLEEEEQRDRGLSPEDARYAARRAFGNPALIREQTHAVWSWVWLESLAADVRYSLRTFRRTPFLTVVAVLALSVGIGLNAGIFSILNSLFLSPPTRTDPQSFVQIFPRYEGWNAGASELSPFNAEDFAAIRREAQSLTGVTAWAPWDVMLDESHKEQGALLVSGDFFRTFGISRVIAGRLLLPQECEPGTEAHVVLLSDLLWKQVYASDPHIVGKSIHIDNQPFTVVGIASDDAGSLLPAALWIPYTLQPALNDGIRAFHDPTNLWLNVAGRLRPGYTRADARSEIQTILRRQDRLYLDQRALTLDRKTSVVLSDGSYIGNPILQDRVIGAMILILGPLTLVLLLACTNVTMLFLSRSILRRGEIAVRLALGAGQARLTRMLMVESFLTALAAGIVAIWLAIRVPPVIIEALDRERTFAPVIHPDWRVFAYLAVLVLAAAVISSLAPAREGFRFDLVTGLKGREGAATARTSTTSALIVVQLAMSFVLLAAAVMFLKMPSTIEGIDPGFETHNLMTVPLGIQIPPYTWPAARAFYRTLDARIAALPGVQSYAYADIAPFRVPQPQQVRLENQIAGHGRAASIDNITPGFFSTFSIPLLRGRAFLPSDAPASGPTHVAVVSAAFARAFWGGEDPLGKLVVPPDGRRLVVIGVARDTRSERFGMVDGPRLYTLRDADSIHGQLFVRFSGDAQIVAREIQLVVHRLDPTQDAPPSTVWDLVQQNAQAMEALAKIILFMASIAIILAIAGVYAVLTFVINRRTREFAIRMMLGATRESIFGAVLKRGLRQIALGLLCGFFLTLPAVWSLARFTARSHLPIRPFDFSMYGISALILLVVSLCAMTLPGLRATKVDPMQSLRSE